MTEFKCPKCHHSLKLTESVDLLTEAAARGATIFAFGSSREQKCPYCGNLISYEEIAESKKKEIAESKSREKAGQWGCLIIIIITVALLYMCSRH